MEIKINIEKKHLIFFAVLLFLIGSVFVIAQGNRNVFHEPLYTNTIEPKSGDVIEIKGNIKIGEWKLCEDDNICYELSQLVNNEIDNMEAYLPNPDNWVEVVNMEEEGKYTEDTITPSGGPSYAMGKNRNGWQTIQLNQNNPVFGIKLSGSSDDGGICAAQIRNQITTVITRMAGITELGLDGRVVDGRIGNTESGIMPTTEFIFNNLNDGIYHSELVDNSKIGTWTRGLTNDYRDNILYHKSMNQRDYIDGGKILHYRQYYNNGVGPGYAKCNVKVLYGEYRN